MRLMRSGAVKLLRDERGLTLFELLISVSVGLAVLSVVFMVMNVSVSQTAKVNDRVEAVQRGRITMETITRELRSQVCPPSTGAALTQAQDNSVTFYVDLSGGASNPEQRQITYDPTTRTLTEYSYVGTGTWPDMTYPATATRTRELLKNAVPVGSSPVFTYYAYDSSGAQQQLATPVTGTANLARIVRVGVSFSAQPSRTNQAARSTTFQSAVDTRTSDPNNPTQGTRCI
jgi:Tfp pilus assembly protein PilW